MIARLRLAVARRASLLVDAGVVPSSKAAGDSIDESGVARLVEVGLSRKEVLDLHLTEAAVDLPVDWRSRGNRLYVARGVEVAPRMVVDNSTLLNVEGFLIVLGSPVDNLAALLVDGRDGIIYIGPECWLPNAQIHCGDGSSVVLRRLVTCTWSGSIDARNGGSVFADADQLWSSDVYVSTDDMHALLNADTGVRLNPRGAQIVLGEHVWLGYQSVVNGNCSIGAHSILALRSVARNSSYPRGVVLAGTPARIVRENVTWSRDDAP